MYVPETSATPITGTAEFFPQHYNVSKISSVDAATQATNNLIAVLQKPSPALPHLDLSSDHTKALKDLASIFNNATAKLDKNNTITLMAPAPFKINLQQKQQLGNTKHTDTTNNTLKQNNNMYPHIIPIDDEEKYYTMARESLTPTANNFNKN